MISEIRINEINDERDNKQVLEHMLKETKSLSSYENPSIKNVKESDLYRDIDSIFSSYKSMIANLENQQSHMYGKSLLNNMVKAKSVDLKVPDVFLRSVSEEIVNPPEGWNGVLVENPNPSDNLYSIDGILIFMVTSIFIMVTLVVYYSETYE